MSPSQDERDDECDERDHQAAKHGVGSHVTDPIVADAFIAIDQKSNKKDGLDDRKTSPTGDRERCRKYPKARISWL